MDWMIATGSICLGLLIGALVAWFVNEADQMSSKVLSSSVGIVSGGGVLALFGFLAGGMHREIWLYPAGLLFGFMIVTTIEICVYGYDGNKAQRKRPTT